MKILAIRLKNLTSIEGTVEVDFTAEPLHSAGIFAISGPTGAGKSTLLDALCLALYDKAPRFATSVESVNLADVGDNQINQSDVRNLLRRGTSDGYAEVDFLGIGRSHFDSESNECDRIDAGRRITCFTKRERAVGRKACDRNQTAGRAE